MKWIVIDPETDGVKDAMAINGTPWVIWKDGRGIRHEGPLVVQSGGLCARDETNAVVTLLWSDGRPVKGSVTPGSVRVIDANHFDRIVFMNGGVLSLCGGSNKLDGTTMSGITPDGERVVVPLSSVRYVVRR